MDKTASGLGYAGLLPFIALTIAGITGDDHSRVLTLFLAYGAVILSFLGGIHWGIAMHDGGANASRQLAACMLPALAAWIALTLERPAALAMLAASYLFWWIYDRAVIATPWYRTLRRNLTLTVLLLHLVWLIRLYLPG